MSYCHQHCGGSLPSDDAVIKKVCARIEMKRNRNKITGGINWDDSYWKEEAYQEALKEYDVAVPLPQLTPRTSHYHIFKKC
jgi:hypothetical protein